jgi:hypothetical protein
MAFAGSESRIYVNPKAALIAAVAAVAAVAAGHVQQRRW